MKLTIDVETFSRVNLKTAGLYRYAEDESTDLNCVCWAFDDGPVSAWIPAGDQAFADALAALKEIDGKIYISPEVPTELILHIADEGEVHAWNASFERRVFKGPGGRRYGWPDVTIKQTRC